jgi:hypothetical protein
METPHGHRKYMVSPIVQPVPESPLRFIITDCPDNQSFQDYIQAVEAQGMSDSLEWIVRICSASSYDRQLIPSRIQVIDDFHFDDGQVPTNAMVSAWITFLIGHVRRFHPQMVPYIAIHCHSGTCPNDFFLFISQESPRFGRERICAGVALATS